MRDSFLLIDIENAIIIKQMREFISDTREFVWETAKIVGVSLLIILLGAIFHLDFLS